MKYLFVVGSPRSGTTWLQILLAQHPQIATTSETHVYTQYLSKIDERWKEEKSRMLKGFKVSGLTKILSSDEFVDVTRSFVMSIYQKVIEKNSEKEIFLDKTPENLLYANQIIEHFPKAYFIHIIRDPRAVAASFKSAKKSWWPWTDSGNLSIAARWSHDVREGKKIATLCNTYFEVRYEDLLDKKKGIAILGMLFEFIGHPLSYDECRISYENCSIENLRSPEKKELKKPWKIGTEPSDFFRKGTENSWIDELSRYDVFEIEKILSKDMTGLNYSTSYNRHNTFYEVMFFLKTKYYRTLKFLYKISRGVEWRLLAAIRRV